VQSSAIYSQGSQSSPDTVANYFIAKELRTKCDIRANVVRMWQCTLNYFAESQFDRYLVVRRLCDIRVNVARTSGAKVCKCIAN